MLSITAYLDFVNALYHLVRGFLLARFGERKIAHSNLGKIDLAGLSAIFG